MLVVGDREVEQGAVSVRRHGRRDLGSQPLAEVIGWMRDEVAAKRAPSVADRPAAAPGSPGWDGRTASLCYRPRRQAGLRHAALTVRPSLRWPVATRRSLLPAALRGLDRIAHRVTYALYATNAANEERRGAHLKTEHRP